jgi:hypothetical protein
MHDPLIILAPPRSFTSVVCAMLGQHPQMYGLPEVNLFVAETMRERQGIMKKRMFADSGLLRTVAQLCGGEQTVRTVALAKRWVRLRMDSACVSVMRELAEKVQSRILVDKSLATVRWIENMQRIRRAFPGTRFIHLLRHPRTQGQSLFEMERRNVQWPIGTAYELGALDFSTDPPTIDLQKVWFSIHTNIYTFLATVQQERWLRIRGEDFLADPDPCLIRIAEWLGLCTDNEAIELMKHPERSPYAGIGPINALFGNDVKFLRDPRLRLFPEGKSPSLEGPLPWREDGRGFSTEVIQLATEFGYL